EGGAEPSPFAHAEHEEHVVAQRAPDFLEERRREVRRRVMRPVGAFVTLIEKRPVGRRDVAAALALEGDARLRELAPLLLHLLALVVREGGEEIGEVAIS